MVHLNDNQYSALRAFSDLVKRELRYREMNKELSSTTYLIGMEYGFCKDEIHQIIDVCFDELCQVS